MLGDITRFDEIYIVCVTTDMRKSIDGLCNIIIDKSSITHDSRYILQLHIKTHLIDKRDILEFYSYVFGKEDMMFCNHYIIKIMKHKYAGEMVAKYIINKCTEDNMCISNLQLQKILFFIQRDYIKRFNEAMFDLEIEAWQFGPVIPEIYYKYCVYGAMPIYSRYEVELDVKDKNIIDNIIEQKRVKNPWELVEETHKAGDVWSKVYKAGRGNRDIISKDLIGSY